MSVGVRPLPPIEVMETEDPEKNGQSGFDPSTESILMSGSVIRLSHPCRICPCSRIATAKAPIIMKITIRTTWGETVFFNAESNAFVMPYAEPVTRRAMTPPPRGRVPVGPGRGHRPHVGSVGGMSLPGGRGRPRPHPRSGSAMSGRFRGPPSIPGSAPGSRAGSRAPMNRKPIPPPAALNTLPTPSKLKDDSMALLGSVDFAPPEDIRRNALLDGPRVPWASEDLTSSRFPISSPPRQYSMTKWQFCRARESCWHRLYFIL